jgi:two-component system, response regulator / RNA-binding antiterminator
MSKTAQDNNAALLSINRCCIALFNIALHHVTMSALEISILIVDDSSDRALLIEQALRDAGHFNVRTIHQIKGIAREIETQAPDVIVMDLGNPNRDFLEHMFRLSKSLRKPIAMFVDQSSDEAMLNAVEAGVSAYVVDGLKRERVKPILDLAIARFKAFEKLRGERDDAIQALADRKVIERAKGILMRLQNISEPESFETMRNAAMQQKKTLVEIACTIIAAAQMTGSQT